jgi:hypothetical protein
MVIWSILTEPAWDELRQKGRLEAKARHVDNDYLAAYAWMVSQMERRLAIPRPSVDAMPIWAWWQWCGVRRRPDLRAGWHLPKGTRGVRFELEVENDRVLLSDFDLWHYVLNYLYLPKTERGGNLFEKKLARMGLSVYACNHNRPLAHAKCRRAVERSWDRIFDLSWTDPRHLTVKKANERSIQGTLWEIRFEDVVAATEFVAR